MIRKAGLITLRGPLVLLVRTKHGSALLLPGGKLEPGETELECLHRELREELGDVQASGLEKLGTYYDEAAGQPDRLVQIELYLGELTGEPVASAEVRELVWFGPLDDRARLAPSLRRKILPDLIERRILDWP
jgi:8-oxo-dGTP pyrophosphatase MutT (NUDIX family)